MKAHVQVSLGVGFQQGGFSASERNSRVKKGTWVSLCVGGPGDLVQAIHACLAI